MDIPNQRLDGDLLHYSVMGLEFALTFCLFTVGGLALDKAFNTLPGSACIGLYGMAWRCGASSVSKTRPRTAKQKGAMKWIRGR